MKWIQWAKELQAISQTGLHFAEGPYDKERYHRLGEISAEIMASHTSLSYQEVVNLNAREFGYATPKVDVRGAIFKDSKILLVREVMDEGRWTLPGGWADVNESPATAVEREIIEECGFETKVVKLLAAYDREKQKHQPPFPYHVYKLFFQCEITGGEAKASAETSEVAFFPEDEIPQLSISRVTPPEIKRCFEYLRNPNLPTDFD